MKIRYFLSRIGKSSNIVFPLTPAPLPGGERVDSSTALDPY